MSKNLEKVTIKRLFEEKTIPLLIEPTEGSFNNFNEFKEWFIENKDFIKSKLFEAGALLFRGFPINGAEDLEKVASSYDPKLLNYVGGNSPRDLVTSKVYTSTSYPPKWRISLHNEVSYLKNKPLVLFFYCDIPAEKGGQTPVADARVFLNSLDPKIKDKFTKKGIKYVQNFYDGVLGKPWQKTFETEDKNFVESFCKSEDAEFFWGENDKLKIVYKREATIKHPETNEEVWFNQADQWHSSALDDTAKKFLLGKMKDDEIPHNAFYGDDSRITDEDIKSIQDLYYKQATYFMWQKNDLLIVDNLLATHGREPFEGNRKILVSMV